MLQELVFFLEEPSAKCMLKGLLPRLLPSTIKPVYVVFEGKNDLEKQLPVKLRGWRKPNLGFVVLRDQDSEDCIDIKDRIRAICRDSGQDNTLIRIVCRELESWYLGDLQAVETALNIPEQKLSRLQNQRKYRNPDNILKAKEELKKITKNSYKPVSGSTSIGKHIRMDQNTSHSFRVFISGISRLANIQNAASATAPSS